MRIDVLSLFPELIANYCEASVLGIALEKQLYELNVHNPRDYTLDKHKRVDDTPYGGGAGMVLQCQPFIDCLELVLNDSNRHCKEREAGRSNLTDGIEIIVTSPSGRKFNQELAQELSQKQQLIILCGRYEGFDQRIRERATMEISVGDYVLTGGELPALTIIDATLRHIPGVLGDATSIEEESFSEVNYLAKLEELQISKKELQILLDETGLNKDDLKSLKLLEYPQYTRPAEFHGKRVPEVLEQGDHKKIFLWRLIQAINLTKQHRKDLIK